MQLTGQSIVLIFRRGAPNEKLFVGAQVKALA
jgi:hypothetical protein